MKKKLFLIVLLAAVLCFCAAAAEDVKAVPLKLNGSVSGTIKEYGDFVYFSFEPSETAVYLLNVTSGKTKAHVTLYESEVDLSRASLSSGTNECLYELEAGKKYYYCVQYMAYNAKGTVKAKLTKADYRWSLEDGVLTVSGKIPVPNYQKGAAPWYGRREEITSLVLEEGITSFGDGSFRGLDNLTEIRIPASLTDLSFLNTVYPRLTGIEVSPKNKNYSSEDGVLFDKKKTQLLLYPAGKEDESYTVPDGVTEINTDAFKNSRVKEVLLPDSLKDIRSGAFENAALVSVCIPKNVDAITQNPFRGCSSLTEIIVPADSLYFASEDGVLYDKELLTLMIYPAGKPDAAFRIPDRVQEIGSEAFADCAYLTSVTVPATVTEAGADVFSGCSLKDLYLDGPTESWNVDLIQSLDFFGVYREYGILRFSDSPESEQPPQQTDEELERLLGRKTPLFPAWLDIEQADVADGTVTFRVSRAVDSLAVTESGESGDNTVSAAYTDTISFTPQDPSDFFSLQASLQGINPDMDSYYLTLNTRFYFTDDGQIREGSPDNICSVRYDTGAEFGYISYTYGKDKTVFIVSATIYTRTDDGTEETRTHYYLTEDGWEIER